jgi:hypothetical protein
MIVMLVMMTVVIVMMTVVIVMMMMFMFLLMRLFASVGLLTRVGWDTVGDNCIGWG